MRRALASSGLALLALACAPARAPWTYATPEAVDASALFARLAPRVEGELVLANFWASW